MIPALCLLATVGFLVLLGWLFGWRPESRRQG